MRRPKDRPSTIKLLLLEALAQIEKGNPPGAAWRVANAGGHLRMWLESDRYTQVQGLDEPTTDGFVLPNVAPTPEEPT